MAELNIRERQLDELMGPEAINGGPIDFTRSNSRWLNPNGRSAGSSGERSRPSARQIVG